MFKVRLHEERPLIWWFEQQEQIDMEPRYQRESGLWSMFKRAYLIDSILNDYDMPKLYLADFTYVSTALNVMKKPYAVIDGKQRLLAFYMFFKGELKLNNDFIYNPEPSLAIAGMNYHDLKLRHPEIAEKVENHMPTVMSVITNNDSYIRQLFVRLNSGVAANSAERRNAMDGIVPDLIRVLAEHRFFKTKIKFSVLRMAEFNVSAKLLLIEHRNRFVDTKAANLDGLVKEGLVKKGAVLDSLKVSKQRVKDILDVMNGIFHDRDSLLTAAGSIPIYYWLTRNNLESAGFVRDFLDEFVHRIQENQQTLKEDPQAGDPELSNYYTMGRTTNDQGSLEGRYKIIEKRFQQFIKN